MPGSYRYIRKSVARAKRAAGQFIHSAGSRWRQTARYVTGIRAPVSERGGLMRRALLYAPKPTAKKASAFNAVASVFGIGRNKKIFTRRKPFRR